VKKVAIGCLATIGVITIVFVIIGVFAYIFNPDDNTSTTTNDTSALTETNPFTQTTSVIPNTIITTPPIKPETPISTSTSQTNTITTTTRNIQTETVDLSFAQSAHLINYSAIGTGDRESIELSVTSNSNTSLIILIPQGTIFTSLSTGIQKMVVINYNQVVLNPGQTLESIIIDTVCMDMFLEVPDKNANFITSIFPASGDLEKLIGIPDFQNKTFRVQQFAAWIVTDNPERTSFIEIDNLSVDSGPNDDEIQQIKDLFQLAGIPTEQYLVFQEVIPVVSVEFVDAIQKGLIEANAYGSGSIDRIKLSITSKSDDILEIVILPGTIFGSSKTNIQKMVVTSGKTLSLLYPYKTIGPLNIDAACASMELTAPSESDNLTLSIETPPEDLNKLLYLSDFRSETYRVQQFAIWTITDNPERDGYVGIATGFQIYGTGPSDAEIERIRILFIMAGIKIDKYKVFQ
jgi:hypothetical protein